MSTREYPHSFFALWMLLANLSLQVARNDDDQLGRIKKPGLCGCKNKVPKSTALASFGRPT